jgi:mRNA interferase YafQ
MRKLDYSSQFKRDVKQAKKRGKKMHKLKALLTLLIDGKTLPASYLDHPLKGEWRGFRDVHIEPDWLLIYKITDNIIRFERTGSHTDLFNS